MSSTFQSILIKKWSLHFLIDLLTSISGRSYVGSSTESYRVLPSFIFTGSASFTAPLRAAGTRSVWNGIEELAAANRVYSFSIERWRILFVFFCGSATDARLAGGCRSAWQEYALIVSLEMFNVMLEKCNALLLEQLDGAAAGPTGGRLLGEDLQIVLPAVKVGPSSFYPFTCFFFWILSSFTGFHWVLLGFTGFY